MRKITAALTIALLFTCALSVHCAIEGEKIASGIVRLHVIANSDSASDQALKLRVRDAILSQGALCDSKAKVCDILPQIEMTARSVLEAENVFMPVSAQYGRFAFPTKQYAGFALPAGEYDAVRVTLGEGKGQNWWCVLFPPLCYVDAATDSSALRSAFGDEYDILTANESGALPVKIKFKLLEIFNHENESSQ